jgi:hypothetical protein
MTAGHLSYCPYQSIKKTSKSAQRKGELQHIKCIATKKRKKAAGEPSGVVNYEKVYAAYLENVLASKARLRAYQSLASRAGPQDVNHHIC